MICIPVNIKRAWVPHTEVTFEVLAPITVPGRVSQRANAILLNNAGNTDVILGNGLTIVAGQSITMGDYQAMTIVKLDVIAQFDEDGVATPNNRLEICLQSAKFSGSGYYVDQPAVP